jgi:hypothetical protein
MSLHPDPEKVAAALDRDTEQRPYILTQQPTAEHLARVARFRAPTFWRYEFGEDLPPLPPCRALPAGLLVAVDDGRRIMIRARDGRVEFDAIELLGQPLGMLLNDVIARRLPEAPHWPRVTIGGLTVSREMWSVAPADMKFLAETEPGLQFAAVRRWARERGMPNRVFYRSPLERKPCYLDFDSSLYVRLFVKLMKRVPADRPVHIVEMLPDVEQTWLHDAEGERYTCELRIVARHQDDTFVASAT